MFPFHSDMIVNGGGASAAGYSERTMNVEKTIEFILQHQARTEVVLARVTDRQDRAEKSMTGIRTILKTGMRMMVKLTAAQKRTESHLDRLGSNLVRLEQKVERLAEAQGHTQKSLDRLIKSLHGPHTNGR
jgi:predicted  nucleic acid-binding Zn-ribbon protein